MSDYCKTCEREVARCYDTSSGCCGGGHCWSCMGYNFETDEEQEEREANAAINKVLENEQNSN